MRIILALLQSPSTAVVYECASTLTALSGAPTAVRAAANCYCQLLVSQSDNNVKLIVLDRLQELKDKHRDVMQVHACACVCVCMYAPLPAHPARSHPALHTHCLLPPPNHHHHCVPCPHRSC